MLAHPERKTARQVPIVLWMHGRTLQMVQGLIMLYAQWHKGESRKGYDVKAAQWRAKLPEVESANEQGE